MAKLALILCTGNSCRSQMAEGIWRHEGHDVWEAFSAGSNPAGFVHPLAIRAMAEIGIDISKNDSKHLNEFVDQEFDVVVTVCDSAAENCPVFPRAQRTLHWPFDDPAHAEGSEQQRMAVFRRVRDQIAARIRQYLTQPTGGES